MQTALASEIGTGAAFFAGRLTGPLRDFENIQYQSASSFQAAFHASCPSAG